MMEGNCKCMHHGMVKVMAVLVGFAALGFWWATAFKTHFLWMDGEHFFKDAILLVLLIFVSKHCSCCMHHGMGTNTCMHGDSCKCGDCGNCK